MEVLNRERALRKLQRMAYEIVEDNFSEPQIILAGIKSNGSVIAHLIKEYLEKIYKGAINEIQINIDKKFPKQVSLDLNDNDIDLNKGVIILVDDVANTGRTLTYALRPFLDYYPIKIQTLVLVERSHKRFPITPDYKGLSIATALTEKIVVETKDNQISGATILDNLSNQ